MLRKWCSSILLFFISLVFSVNAATGFVNYAGLKYWVESYGSGKPTLVLLSGVAQDTSVWQHVIPSLARLSSVFVYDRAGIGKSEPMQDKVTARTAEYIVSHLRALLKLKKVKPPYVLVANGLGSSYARYFARQYPGEVTGMVLINPAVNAAIALGQVKHYAKGEQVKQSSFRKQYNHNIHNLRQKVIDYNQTVGKVPMTYNQATVLERYLEQIGEVASEHQIIQSPPLRSIPVVVLQGNQDNSLAVTMSKQIAAQSAKGEYIFSNNKNELADFSPQQIVSAVKKVL